MRTCRLRVGVLRVVVLRVFTLIRRHVTRTAVRAVVVARSGPHIDPLIRTACAAVEVSKEHEFLGRLLTLRCGECWYKLRARSPETARARAKKCDVKCVVTLPHCFRDTNVWKQCPQEI